MGFTSQVPLGAMTPHFLGKTISLSDNMIINNSISKQTQLRGNSLLVFRGLLCLAGHWPQDVGSLPVTCGLYGE